MQRVYFFFADFLRLLDFTEIFTKLMRLLISLGIENLGDFTSFEGCNK